MSWGTFNITIYCNDVKQVSEWINSGVKRDDKDGWVWPDDESMPHSTGLCARVSDDDDGHTRVTIRGDSKYCPPMDFAEAIKREFPASRVVVSRDDGETFERWEVGENSCDLLDCVEFHRVPGNDEMHEIVYVKDGKQIYKLPSWLYIDDSSGLPEAPSLWHSDVEECTESISFNGSVDELHELLRQML